MNKVRLLTAPLMALIKLHWIALCIAAGALLFYTLAGFFLVPYIARSQIESYVTQTLHRQVSIGEIRFNPFFLDASISDFRLQEADGSPLVSFRHLYVNAQLASLWRRGAILKEVQLSEPNIELIVAQDASVNLAKLFPPSAEAEAEAPSEPTPVRIGSLSVRSGRLGVTDFAPAKPFHGEIMPIRFALNDFRTDADFANAYDFSGTTTRGEQLAWTGEFTVQPLGSTGRFSIDGLKISSTESYANEMLPFRLTSGEADLAGTYRFALDPAFALDVTLPTVQVRDLALAERTGDAAAPVLLPAIDVQQVQFSYDKRDVGVKLVEVKDARIDLALERDGSVSLMRLLGESATPTPTLPRAAEEGAEKKAPTTTSPPPPAGEGQGGGESEWRVHVDSIHLGNATLTAEDRSVEPATKFELAPVQLTLDNWSTDENAKLQIDTDITIDKQGHLLARGDLQLDPFNTQLAIELKDFDLPVVQPYLAKATAMTLHSGRVGAKGDVTYAATPESAQPMTFKGEVQVADLRTTDQLVNEDFLKWRNLALTGVSFSLNPDRLSIERIVARQPYARVVIAQDTSLNVTRVLNPEGPVAAPADTSEGESQRTASAASKPADPVFPARIGTVQLIDGSANFADYSIDPSFATGILELNGTIVGLSSNEASRAKVKLDGKVDKYAPVDIGGEVNLLSATAYTDLAMNFHNMELTTFNPYSGKFAGYNISKGKLSTELRYKVQDRKLDAAHHIVVDNLEFGTKTDSKDAAPIPVKLAVALLKDRNGIIDVNLPVTGTIDDPQFRLGPIIWKAILGLLTKIVTAPFAALGALFGGGDELAYVDFTPGSAVLAPTEAEKLSTLSKALVERPQLKLNVPLTVVTEADSAAVAEEQLAATLPPAGDLTDDKAKQARLVELQNAYQQIARTAPIYPPETKTQTGVDLDAAIRFLDQALLEHLQPDDAALTELGRQRARAVQDTLLANTELNPERVFITAERTEGKSQNNVVRMEMKLE